MKTRRKGQFCIVLTLKPRLCVALNKGIFDSGLNSNNCYRGGFKECIKHERQYLIRISRHREERDEIRGVWIADETLSRVFDTSSQTKTKQKRRGKIVKIYAN